ncbi:hypothetical protein ACWGDT_07760 [Streptomyces avermitilis]
MTTATATRTTGTRNPLRTTGARAAFRTTPRARCGPAPRTPASASAVLLGGDRTGEDAV